jgi:hypothetical protein
VRAFGPLRIGVLPTIQAEEVIVEKFDDPHTSSGREEDISLERILHSLTGGTNEITPVEAQMRGFTYKRHGDDGSETTLRARACRTVPEGLLCRVGWISERGELRHFDEIIYQGGNWEAPGAVERVKGKLDG